MNETLSARELVTLIKGVFAPTKTDRGLAILVDLPDDVLPDNNQWRDRRVLAYEWVTTLRKARSELGIQEVFLYTYRNVRANNADLPQQIALVPEGAQLPLTADDIDENWFVPLRELFGRCSILMAMTELSATAPLKVIGWEGGIRAATMPGFTRSMIPALKLDYDEINRRCNHLKKLLDEAENARVLFHVGETDYRLYVDLRFRSAHASGGIHRRPGLVGNLPSGETYIVPYEGEIKDEPSRTQGVIPVQFGDEVILYRIAQNKAVEILSRGPKSEKEAEAIQREPAYANVSELGFGVLSDFGVKPCGEILLDEKLGVHIAFGRSDHFGGYVGPGDFSSPDAVVHIDRVYLPQTQPGVTVGYLDLETPDREPIRLIEEGEYAIKLGKYGA